MKIISLLENTNEGMHKIPAGYIKMEMYRGMTDRGDVVKVPVRTDRRPLSASIVTSVAFNLIFERKFGFADVRKRSVYATTELETAASYGAGSVYALHLPKDAKVAYIQNMRDSMNIMEKIATQFNDQPALRMLDSFLYNTGDYTSKPSKELWEIAINQFTEHAEKLQQWLTECEQFLEHYEVDTAANLDLTNMWDTEFMIFDLDDYYATKEELDEWDYADF